MCPVALYFFLQIFHRCTCWSLKRAIMDNDRAPSRSPSLHYLSKITVRPPSISDSCKPTRRRIHLSPWDLRLLSVNYIQTGLLLPKPQSLLLHSIATRLERSLSLTLLYFSPLAGRLVTTHHHTASSLPSLSLSIDCNDQGAELIVATSETVSARDVLACRLLPSLFPLNGSICHDGHSLPLLAVQLTELKDAVFLACAMNHAVADGTSLWHFINSWSEITRAGPGGDYKAISRPPFLDRWFPEPLSAPLQLPFTDLLPMLRRYHPPPLSEVFFHFSGKTIAELKVVANAELSTEDRISSLQALLAHLWRSVARARNLAPEQGTAYFLAAGNRGRVEPPLPAAYFGNAVLVGAAKVSTRELAAEGLGRAAQRLNEAVAAQRDAYIREVLVAWAEKPSFVSFNDLGASNMLTGGSPRFDVFGNDFGWGRPLAVRSGPANKIDGTATAYPGCEVGSVGVQLCLSEPAMRSLMDDEEFMSTVCSELEEAV